MPNAPLFYSATDEFREEDDEEEHQREVADYYALQRSRRQIGGSHLEASSEADEDASRGSELEESSDTRDVDGYGRRRGGGIRSSWRGDGQSLRAKNTKITGDVKDDRGRQTSPDLEGSSKSQGNLAEIGLESIKRTSTDSLDRDEPPDDLAIEIQPDDDPPSVQQFRKPPVSQFQNPSPFLAQETEPETMLRKPHLPDSDDSSPPATVSYPVEEPPRHDSFWGTLYLISLAALLSSCLLVYLHTETPSSKRPLGDTVYTTLHASYHLLAVDTLVAVIVSLLWLAILRSYVRPLIYTILVAVPTIFISFFLYPFVSSFKGQYHGASIQDKAMRYFSLVPLALAWLWTFNVYRARHSLAKAISVLEFACKILTANPELLVLGFAALVAVTVWTWIWLAMFTRVFLGGSFSATKPFFVLDLSTWWLGIFFVLVYLWTLAIISGIQRATTAATVSQWYFHRLAVPAPTSRQVILAAFSHALSTLFGTICLSTLLALLIRLPFLIFPRRVLALAGFCSYTLIPTSILTLTSPLTLTYSAIHSQPQTTSSRALTRLSYLSSTPVQHTLSLLLLRATRFITSLAFGFGAWVNTARLLPVSPITTPSSDLVNLSLTHRGSIYAYVVGLLAAAIGWAVLGAMDGVLTGVVDAAVVCWHSESARGEVRYCREAEWLFEDQEEARTRGGFTILICYRNLKIKVA